MIPTLLFHFPGLSYPVGELNGHKVKLLVEWLREHFENQKG